MGDELNFMRSALADKVVFYSARGEGPPHGWKEFPPATANALFWAFAYGRPELRTTIKGWYLLFDLARMKATNLSCGCERSIGWRDYQGVWFLPRDPFDSGCPHQIQEGAVTGPTSIRTNDGQWQIVCTESSSAPPLPGSRPIIPDLNLRPPGFDDCL